MNTFRNFALTTVLLAAGLGAAFGQTTGSGQTTWTLTAGQTMNAGMVTVSNDDTNIYVTYTLTDPNPQATFDNLHLWVGKNIANVPGNNNPSPGQFCNAAGGACYDVPSGTILKTYTFTIPFSAIDPAGVGGLCGTQLAVVPHATVEVDKTGGGTVSSQTAFGGNISGGSGSRWWYYGQYSVTCAKLGNLVWRDTNNNGQVDSGEPGIAGVRVELYKNGVYQTYTTTDASGQYLFSNLTAGNYTVQIPASNFVRPGALVDYAQSSSVTDTADNQQDNDDNGIQSGGNGTLVTSPVIHLSAGETDLTIDFGFTVPGTATTPVTLSYFQAVGDNGQVTIEWRTATEAGNIGFTLYVWQDGEWVELASVPSSVIDSVEETVYRYEASGVVGNRFAVVDIDRFGQETVHGAFELNQAYGWAPEEAAEEGGSFQTDWEAIRAENEAKQAELQAARKAEQQQNLIVG